MANILSYNYCLLPTCRGLMVLHLKPRSRMSRITKSDVRNQEAVCAQTAVEADAEAPQKLLPQGGFWASRTRGLGHVVWLLRERRTLEGQRLGRPQQQRLGSKEDVATCFLKKVLLRRKKDGSFPTLFLRRPSHRVSHFAELQNSPLHSATQHLSSQRRLPRSSFSNQPS